MKHLCLSCATVTLDKGLELKPSKTRITHTLHPHEGNLGFDFLGFHVRQFQVGKSHSGKNPQGEILGFKTIIRPSDEAIRRHDQSIRTTIRKLQNAPQTALIKQLNPMIRGWTNYYSPVAAKQTFTNLSHRMYLKLRRWTKRRHPNWSGKKVVRKYWRLEKVIGISPRKKASACIDTPRHPSAGG